jgi:hypothetical protein
VRLLLDAQVPHVPGLRAVLAQRRHVGMSGLEPVPRHSTTVAGAYDILAAEGRERRFLPGLKARASSRRSW